mmetsp:Transcript_8705/g.13813  ORF Transcript_8705/g.13813 Transcript_8705/m.13813 type:complete len:210 (+) Transcript_8705:403-1032(+)
MRHGFTASADRASAHDREGAAAGGHRPGPGGPAPVLQRALQLLPRGPDQEGKLHAAELHGRKPAGGSRHLAPRTAVGGRGHCHPHIREGRLFFHRAVRHGAGGGPAARGRLERALGRRLQRRGVGFPNRRGGDGCGGGPEHAVRRGSLHFKRTGVAGHGAERVGGAAGARRGHGRARGRRRGHRRLQLRPQPGPVCWSFTGGSSADCTG